MRRRHTTAGALFALTIAVAACGGGGSALSEDEFVDELNDICRDVNGDLEDIDAPDSDDDFAGWEDLGSEAEEIIDGSVQRLRELDAPEELQNDLDDLIEAAEEQLALAGDFVEAAEDEDADALDEISTDLQRAEDDFEDAADDIGADDCIADDEETESSDPPTTETFTTQPPATDPPTSEPVLTMPPATDPPLTAPPTNAPVGSVTELDVSTAFDAPPGFTMAALEGSVDELIRSIEEDPALGPVTSELGAADVYDATGTFVCRLWVLYTSPDFDLAANEAAGLAWLDWVGEGEVDFVEHTTPGGFTGYISDFGDGSSAFAGIAGSYGIGCFGDAGFDVDGVIDGFVNANAA